jgi:hypothetical protein
MGFHGSDYNLRRGWSISAGGERRGRAAGAGFPPPRENRPPGKIC